MLQFMNTDCPVASYTPSGFYYLTLGPHHLSIRALSSFISLHSSDIADQLSSVSLLTTSFQIILNIIVEVIEIKQTNYHLLVA